MCPSNCSELYQRPPWTHLSEDHRSPGMLLMHWDSRLSRDGAAPTGEVDRPTRWLPQPSAMEPCPLEECQPLFSPAFFSLLLLPSFPANWEPPPSTQAPCLLTHGAAQLGSIRPCPWPWHLAHWPCMRDPPPSDLPRSSSIRILSIGNFPTPHQRKAPLLSVGGAKHPTPSALCQVEWESPSYQLITFRTFPVGGGGGASTGECSLTSISCVSVCSSFSPSPHPWSRAQASPCASQSSYLGPHIQLLIFFWSALFFLSLHFLFFLSALFSVFPRVCDRKRGH